MEIFSRGWCCSDCLFLFANGETPVDLDEADTAAWLDEIDRKSEGLTVCLGGEHEEDCPNMAYVRPHTPRTLKRVSRAYRRRAMRNAATWRAERKRYWTGQTDCDCETQEFSWSPCDTCGSRLGGSRDAVTYFKKGN